MRKRLLTPGEPAPWFSAPTGTNPNFFFDTVAGRYVVLSFFESAARPDSRRILDELWQARARFSDDEVTFFGVSNDPLDQQQARVQEQIPGMRFYWDFDRRVATEYGAVQLDPNTGLQNSSHTRWCSIRGCEWWGHYRLTIL